MRFLLAPRLMTLRLYLAYNRSYDELVTLHRMTLKRPTFNRACVWSRKNVLILIQNQSGWNRAGRTQCTTLKVPSASHMSARAKPSNSSAYPIRITRSTPRPDDVSPGEVAPDYLSLQLTVAPINCRPMNCRRLTVVR